MNAGFVENQAKATGSSPSGTGDVTDDSDDDGTNAGDKTRKILLPTTKPTLTKTATLTTDADSSGDITAGDTLTYTIKLLNDGAVTITSNTIADNLTGFVSGGVSCTGSSSVASLAPTDSCTLTGTYVVSQANADAGSITNTATSSSTNGSDTLARSAALTLVVNQDAGLEVTKTSSGTTNLGDTVSYTILVKNTGNVTVDSITLADTLTDAAGGALTIAAPSFGSADSASAEGTLVPGETATYTTSFVITQAVIDAGGLSNTATASGKDPSDGDVSDVSDDGDDTDGNTADDPSTTAITRSPSLTLIKTASDPTDPDSNGVDVGDVITYTYVATNSGNVTLTNVVVAETQADFTGTGTLPSPAYASGGSDQDSDSAADDLAVDESVTWTATYALTQSGRQRRLC